MPMDTMADCRATFAAAEQALRDAKLLSRFRLQRVGMCDDRIRCAVGLLDQSSGPIVEVLAMWTPDQAVMTERVREALLSR